MRWVMVGLFVTAAVVTLAGDAWSHKGKLPDDARTLVQQAGALLAQNPAMRGEVRERLQAALKSSKPEGVHLDQVRGALQALDRRDVAATRRLLMESIMPAGMPMPPEGPRRMTPAMPSAPGRSAASPGSESPQPSNPPSVDVAMSMAEPLRINFTGSTTETILLAVGLALIGVGITALWRDRMVVRP